MNKGIKLASGSIVGILNGDDIFYDNACISAVFEEFKKKKVEAVYGNLVYVSPENLNTIVRYYNSDYFMTIPEASQLILQAGAMGNGGETFILEMGNSIKIADMARDLIRFSGFEPDVDIKIEYIGLRPGEKLYEELITDGEGIVPSDHKKIMVLSGQTCDNIQLNNDIDIIIEYAKNQDEEKIRTMLMKIVPEYVPTNNGN